LIKGLAIVEKRLLVQEVEAPPTLLLEPLDEETSQLPVASL
jgi:hypothetical protein